ncbi:MAG: transposase [bacterium]
MKLYNKKSQFSSQLQKFVNSFTNGMSKPIKDRFISLVVSLMTSESGVSADLARRINTTIKNASMRTNLYRFFNNKNFNQDLFYKNFIITVIQKIKFKHNNAYITIDHTFEKNEFVTIMFTLRINNQGIPIFFRSAKTKEFCKNNQKELDDRIKVFDGDLIINAITEVSSYFKDKNVNLIFLADRWFPNLSVLNHIDKLGHKYVFRLKQDSNLGVFTKLRETDFNKAWHTLSEIKPKKHCGKYIRDLIFGKEEKYKANLAIAMAKKTQDPWYLITNMEPEKAVATYSYRFGAIECLFKNTKSNGFRLEKSRIKNIKAFQVLYCLMCFCVVLSNYLALKYIKNKHHHDLDITYCRRTKNGKSERIMSNFKLGLTIFQLIINDIENLIKYKLDASFVMSF